MSVLAALSRVDEASTLVSRMTTTDKVKISLIDVAASLKAALQGLGGLKSRYLDKVNGPNKAEAQVGYDAAITALKEIEVNFNGYNEGPKRVMQA